MAYTEIKERNGKKYFYRVLSVRKGKKVNKKRIYLGNNLKKSELLIKEKEADKKLYSSSMRESKSLQKIKPKIIKILKKYKIKKAGIFGSFVRGDQKKNSDIDIIIEPTKGMGFKFFGLALELEDKLKRKIDLITYKSVNKHLKKYIFEGEKRII